MIAANGEIQTQKYYSKHGWHGGPGRSVVVSIGFGVSDTKRDAYTCTNERRNYPSNQHVLLEDCPCSLGTLSHCYTKEEKERKSELKLERLLRDLWRLVRDREACIISHAIIQARDCDWRDVTAVTPRCTPFFREINKDDVFICHKRWLKKKNWVPNGKRSHGLPDTARKAACGRSNRWATRDSCELDHLLGSYVTRLLHTAGSGSLFFSLSGHQSKVYSISCFYIVDIMRIWQEWQNRCQNRDSSYPDSGFQIFKPKK